MQHNLIKVKKAAFSMFFMLSKTSFSTSFSRKYINAKSNSGKVAKTNKPAPEKRSILTQSKKPEVTRTAIKRAKKKLSFPVHQLNFFTTFSLIDSALSSNQAIGFITLFSLSQVLKKLIKE
jgi:hypothetical protein